MLKLKIGNNYLITNYSNSNKRIILKNIAYIMSSFKGDNQFLVSADTTQYPDPKLVDEILKQYNNNTIFLLTYLDKKEIIHTNHLFKQEIIKHIKNNLHKYINNLKAVDNNIIIKVININDFESTNEFQFALDLLDKLQSDNTNIMSILPYLDNYKTISTRIKQIPDEIKVIDNDIKRLQKTADVCPYKTTLKSLEYLNLIDKAELQGSDLLLTIKELPINPSEPLGEVFSTQVFQSNPYLYKASKYIYQGYHFGMPKTKIKIDTNFKLHFIKALDDRFNYMFLRNNWSGVGYPHFGTNGFCAGEFNDTMAHGREYGLGYYFISLKQYLTTANMRDVAGYKVWWYPIFDDNNKLVYCAGLDTLIEEYIKNYEPQLYEELKKLNWDDKAELLKDHSYDYQVVMKYAPGNYSCYDHPAEDSFLKVLKEKEPELYIKIMKGREN